MDMTIRGIKASSCLHVFQLTPESAASFACWQKKNGRGPVETFSQSLPRWPIDEAPHCCAAGGGSYLHLGDDGCMMVAKRTILQACTASATTISFHRNLGSRSSTHICPRIALSNFGVCLMVLATCLFYWRGTCTEARSIAWTLAQAWWLLGRSKAGTNLCECCWMFHWNKTCRHLLTCGLRLAQTGTKNATAMKTW